MTHCFRVDATLPCLPQHRHVHSHCVPSLRCSKMNSPPAALGGSFQFYLSCSSQLMSTQFNHKQGGFESLHFSCRGVWGRGRGEGNSPHVPESRFRLRHVYGRRSTTLSFPTDQRSTSASLKYVSFGLKTKNKRRTRGFIKQGPATPSHTSRTFQASSGSGDGDAANVRDGSSTSPEFRQKETDGVQQAASGDSEKDPLQIEVAPSVLRVLEKGGEASKDKNSGLGLIERNQRKRRAQLGSSKGDEKSQRPAVIPLSFDADARNDEGRYDGAFSSYLKDSEEILQINTLDDFFPAFVILLTDALLELGDFMKIFGDGNFFSLQALSRASRVPGKTSNLKRFPEDQQLRHSLSGILVNTQALSFFISSFFSGPDGITLNPDENLDSEADLLYNMFYKYKHRQTLTVPLDEPELLEQVFQGSSFIPEGQTIRCRQGLLFRGEFMGKAALAQEELQRRLDEKFEGLVVILLNQEPFEGGRGCLIAHRNELLSLSLSQQGDVLLSAILIAAVLLNCLRFASADPGLDDPYFWQRCIVSLGLLGVWVSGIVARKVTAASYNVSQIVRLPFSLPVPHQGAFGTLVFYKGCLPNRTALLDLSLSSTCASVAFSLALILASHSSWESVSATMADFRGFLLVPDNMFAYSSSLTWILHKLSSATLRGELGDLELVVSPLALAGTLGLHFTAMALLPLGILDGGRILTAVLGRGVQHVVTGIMFLVVLLSLLVTSPWLGLAWVLGSTPALMDDWFQLDEVTEPSFIRKVFGLALIAAAVGSFVPSIS